MTLILDTNVFSNKEFIQWLKGQKIPKFISAVSYAELSYHMQKKGKDEKFVDSFLESLGIRVLPFDLESAKIMCNAVLQRWDFREHARDYMIGSLAVKLNGTLVTENVRDFEWMKKNVKSSREFI